MRPFSALPSTEILMSGRPDSTRQAVLEFKSFTLTVPSLLLLCNDLDAIEQQLAVKLRQAPDFFRHSPLLIDLQQLNQDGLGLDLAPLLQLLKRLDFAPAGVRGAADDQAAQARSLGLPVYSVAMTQVERVAAQKAARKALREEAPPPTAPAPAPSRTEPAVENRLITEPVRSGQRVYARGDLIVTSTVSAGAELVAEGNIHVYGSLRGRALAGVPGNSDCRIFCQDLQAELISIAGIYQLREESAARASAGPVCISLEDQRLVVREL